MHHLGDKICYLGQRYSARICRKGAGPADCVSKLPFNRSLLIELTSSVVPELPFRPRYRPKYAKSRTKLS
ncbi:hypothetical protein ARMGADRAFT_1014226 [Armillaria gallica]|uniref:Uncharacterized protein n=1 Tax=Armillaria gallica TaxID=47427 RepID=A0A2H3D6S6_ARMGA|nr:hypothetical protein ARMGADRAFT_1014226 [Armillaria gallica]